MTAQVSSEPLLGVDEKALYGSRLVSAACYTCKCKLEQKKSSEANLELLRPSSKAEKVFLARAAGALSLLYTSVSR